MAVLPGAGRDAVPGLTAGLDRAPRRTLAGPPSTRARSARGPEAGATGSRACSRGLGCCAPGSRAPLPLPGLLGTCRVHSGSLPPTCTPASLADSGSCLRHKLFQERAQLQAPPPARPTGSVVHTTAWLLPEKGTGQTNPRLLESASHAGDICIIYRNDLKPRSIQKRARDQHHFSSADVY